MIFDFKKEFKHIYNPKTKPSKAISPIPTTFQSKIFVLKNLFTNFIYILLYSYFLKNNWTNSAKITIPAAIRGFNIAIPTRSRIAKIHKTTFNIISPYQITKDCNIKPKKSLTKI